MHACRSTLEDPTLLIDSAVLPEPLFSPFIFDKDGMSVLALAVMDARASARVAKELQRRALDPTRDLWTRTWMVVLLANLLDLDPNLDGRPTSNWLPARPFAYVDVSCAAALLASGTLDDAHYRCVQVWAEVAQRYNEATTADALAEARAAWRDLYSRWMREVASLVKPALARDAALR